MVQNSRSGIRFTLGRRRECREEWVEGAVWVGDRHRRVRNLDGVQDALVFR